MGTYFIRKSKIVNKGPEAKESFSLASELEKQNALVFVVLKLVWIQRCSYFPERLLDAEKP